MGFGKKWSYRLASTVVAREDDKVCVFWRIGGGGRNGGGKKRRMKWWSVLCGSMLFGLGLISLFAGHVASGIEWYSQRLGQGRFYSRLLWELSLGSSLLVSFAIELAYENTLSANTYKSKVASVIEWCSQRLGQGRLYSRLDGGRHSPIDIWKSPYAKYHYGCSQSGSHFPHAVRERFSNGFLLIATSGGLNQQRTGITDAVVVARILNATLVVPELDRHSFWKDDSDFADIFDVNWFIRSLSKDVTVVRRVPDKVMRSMEKPPYTMRVPRKSDPDYYLDQVLPILLRRRVLQLTKFDYRLSNDIDEDLQKLRCRVNYHALRFTKTIRELGERLVNMMRNMSKRYIAIHLRFEPDMLAFSRCYYGGGDKERYELSEIRKRWTNLPDLSPDDEQSRSKCPLTPHEVGLMLRGLGFKNDSYVYVASGEIYGGEKTLHPLRDLFPNFYTKEMLANDELRPYLSFSSQLAAIDYIVCDESDVFVTNNNGNMAKIIAGRRRYMGHKRTIRPNAKKLVRLFMVRERLDWETFSRKVKSYQRGFMGEPDEMRPGRGDFHEFPHSCICEKPPAFINDNDDDGKEPS